MAAGVFPAWAQEPPYPVISRLDNRDTMFRQYMADVESARRALFTSRRDPADQAVMDRLTSMLTIYSYTIREGEDLFSIAARSNIPYGTLASLNRFSNPEEVATGREVLLPSTPGIFVPETPDSGLERLVFAARMGADGGQQEGLVLSIPREAVTTRFTFIPGDDFSPTERIFFFDRGFQFPLQSFRVTSSFGPRINPVTGRAGVHQGIDLAAPQGTEVYAVKSGTVINLGEDLILGKFIMISHDNDWVSVYGHLSSINVTLRQRIQSAAFIGRVGSTGQSTGPHLHFELRQNGQHQDPARLLRLFSGTE